MSTGLEHIRLTCAPPLPGGARFEPLEIGFRRWGRLAADGGNAVLVCPALTGDSDLERWWPELLGPGRALDPERDYIICADVLGGSGRTSGPGSDAGDGRNWQERFPEISVRDMVQVQRLLLDQLGVKRLKLVIGGSLGGMQVLEWLVEHGDRVDAAVTIAAPARQTSWGRSLNHVQRRALDLHGDLELARMIAMLSYRYWDNLEQRFGSDTFEPESTETHPAEAWLDHHGQALRQRFDPISYRRLMSAMDGHDVGRGRGGWRQALRQANAPVQVIGIVSDLLYPPGEHERLARALPCARLDWLNSRHGHDAFLIDQAALNQRVVQFREGLRGARPTTLQACS